MERLQQYWFNKPEMLANQKARGKKCGIPGISQRSHASGDLLQARPNERPSDERQETGALRARLASLVLPENRSVGGDL